MSRPLSDTRSAPVMPTSAAPSATYSGMSAARTKRAWKSCPRSAIRARSPRSAALSPACSRSATAFSDSRPLLGRATRIALPRFSLMLLLPGSYRRLHVARSDKKNRSPTNRAAVGVLRWTHVLGAHRPPATRVGRVMMMVVAGVRHGVHGPKKLTRPRGSVKGRVSIRRLLSGRCPAYSERQRPHPAPPFSCTSGRRRVPPWRLS